MISIVVLCAVAFAALHYRDPLPTAIALCYLLTISISYANLWPLVELGGFATDLAYAGAESALFSMACFLLLMFSLHQECHWYAVWLALTIALNTIIYYSNWHGAGISNAVIVVIQLSCISADVLASLPRYRERVGSLCFSAGHSVMYRWFDPYRAILEAAR